MLGKDWRSVCPTNIVSTHTHWLAVLYVGVCGAGRASEWNGSKEHQ